MSEFPSFEPAERSPKQLLTGLMDRGVQVEVCGIYLPNRDVDESDLIDGVGPGAKYSSCYSKELLGDWVMRF